MFSRKKLPRSALDAVLLSNGLQEPAELDRVPLSPRSDSVLHSPPRMRAVLADYPDDDTGKLREAIDSPRSSGGDTSGEGSETMSADVPRSRSQVLLRHDSDPSLAVPGQLLFFFVNSLFLFHALI